MSAAVPLMPNPSGGTPLWETLADELDISQSLYRKAADRHTSVGEWLCRPGSSLASFGPTVHPQGSFRLGLVIKPIFADASYDLDQVVVLRRLHPQALSQADLKALFGAELAAYAHAYRMQSPEEKHRCWRLNYRDEVAFHLDAVPSVPATGEEVQRLRREGVHEPWAARAVAITDDRHPLYHLVGADWPTSNPRGFARWFEAQAARARSRVVTRGAQASVEDVPAYEWRTPLQRAIQLLKRHRDVMFRDTPALAPISMIITNLATCAYEGEQDLGAALSGIVERMGHYVRPVAPRVPNPTHPAEDYADKWRLKAASEFNFRLWLEQVRADVRYFAEAPLNADRVERGFGIELTEEQQRRLGSRSPARSAAATGAPAVVIPSATPSRIDTAPRPWQSSLPHRGTGS